MAVLSVTATADHGHDNILRSHEWELRSNVTGNDGGVHHESLADVLENRQNHIGREERLRNRQAPVRTVIKRSLHPLTTGRLARTV